MPRIANPISPIAQAFDTIGKVLISMPTVEERAMRESQAALMQAQREKAIIDAEAGRRQLGAMNNIGSIFERMNSAPPIDAPAGPTMAGPPLPTTQMSKDDWARSNLKDLFSAGAALNPNGLAQLGALARAFLANTGGASPQLISNAMLGAGDSMQSTPVGFEQAQAQDMKKHGMSLGNAVRIAQMTSDRAANTQLAINERQLQAQRAQEDRTLVDVETPQGRKTMTMAEWKAMGAPQPNTYGTMRQTDPMSRPPRVDSRAVPSPGQIVQILGEDGRPERSAYANSPEVAQAMQAGKRVVPVQAQPPGTDAFGKATMKDDAAIITGGENINRMFDALDPLLNDPTLFGVTGMARRAVQGISGQASALGQWLGGTTKTFVDELVASGNKNAMGISTLFDPRLPELDVLQNALAYAVARQQNGPGPLTKADVEDARAQLQMTGVFSTAEGVRAAVGQIRRLNDGAVNAARQRVQGGVQRGATGTPAAAPAAAPTQGLPPPPPGFRVQ